MDILLAARLWVYNIYGSSKQQQATTVSSRLRRSMRLA